MKVLNNNCRNDISDQECYHCSINGHITECPEKCEQFEPVISQELMDHYKALGEHYNNKASRIVMEAYMLGRRDAQKKRDNKVSDLIRRQNVLKICDKYNGQGWVWSMIRKEVEELLPVNPQPCEDAISRQAVTDTTICDGISCNECSFNTCEDGQAGCLLKERVDKLPPVNPAKTGHWIDDNENEIDAQYGRHLYKCSECNEYADMFVGGTEDWWDLEKPNYCPNCGAKMIEPQESGGEK